VKHGRDARDESREGLRLAIALALQVGCAHGASARGLLDRLQEAVAVEASSTTRTGAMNYDTNGRRSSVDIHHEFL